jgi:hypothetical protein
MRNTILSLTASLLLFCPAFALDDTKVFDQNIHKQALEYNPTLADSFYCWQIPNASFLEFLEIYKNRPIQTNWYGMRSHGNFFLWYFLKQIKPALVIESGVYRGQSTWTIEQAVPEAKIIALDPDVGSRAYVSKNATYPNIDFAELTIPENLNGPVVCFFDDHMDAFERVLQASSKGIKYLIFDDNYIACDGHDNEFYSLTLRTCFETEKYKEKGAILKKMIKHYYIMPQIIGTTSNHPACEKSTTKLPAIWKDLADVDPVNREKLLTFYNDQYEYRWITYVELN